MPRAWTSLPVLVVFVAQLAVPVVRFDGSRAVPVSGRYSWSMFAGPLTARCLHHVRATTRDGVAVDPPAPDGSAMAAVLGASTPERFSAVAPWFAPYADTDADVARALDDLLRRYHDARCPRLTVESELRCDSPLSAPFHRTSRWPAR